MIRAIKTETGYALVAEDGAICITLSENQAAAIVGLYLLNKDNRESESLHDE